MNHWSSIILTTHLLPHLQITGLSAKSYMMSALPSSIMSALISSLIYATLFPAYFSIWSLIYPLLCSALYNSSVASCTLGSFWFSIPILSTTSTAGNSPYPFTVTTLIGFALATSSAISNSLIKSSFSFKSLSAI